MTTEQKDQIVKAANEYMALHELSQNEFAEKCKVNPAYMSNILKGVYVHNSGADTQADIAVRWFKQIANTIGFVIEKVYWKQTITPQFTNGLHILEEAKEKGLKGILVDDTGFGKTYVVERFVKGNPNHVYRVTVSRLHTLPMIIQDLIEVMGIGGKYRTYNKVKRMADHVSRLKSMGHNPIIILDEAENLSSSVIGMVKALYDAVLDTCGIMLIATPQLIDKLERMKQKDRQGVPQFCRRFKAGIRDLTMLKRDFEPHFDSNGIVDKGLRKLVTSISENYGEISAWLLPVMREADKLNLPVTEQLFRKYHNMPTPQN